MEYRNFLIILWKEKVHQMIRGEFTKKRYYISLAILAMTLNLLYYGCTNKTDICLNPISRYLNVCMGEREVVVLENIDFIVPIQDDFNISGFSEYAGDGVLTIDSEVKEVYVFCGFTNSKFDFISIELIEDDSLFNLLKSNIAKMGSRNNTLLKRTDTSYFFINSGYIIELFKFRGITNSSIFTKEQKRMKIRIRKS